MSITVTVLGCGEAFDASYPNTSLLFRSESSTVLLDCGYSVPPQVWREVPDPDGIGMIYISHAHADHYFGLPAVLGRMWEQGRTTPLVIASQPQVLEQIRQLLELGYVGLPARYKFQVDYVPVQPGRTYEWAGLSYRVAPTRHAVTNLGIRIDAGGKSFCYSGDGTVTEETQRLFARSKLVVYEAYTFEPSPVHADIPALLAFADKGDVQELALIHVQRDLRAKPERIVEELQKPRRWKLSLPEPGHVFTVS